MSREIKFRVWCKTTKHFTDAPHVSCSGRQLLWLHTGNQVTISNLDDGDYAVQQYTGLKDKNGREIYEGDIIELADGSRGEVKFDNGRFFHTAKTEIWGLLYWNQVVGNIFENPELVK